MSDYPHLFDDIVALTSTTQLYTQRRSSVESPNNYRFTIEQLADFLVSEFGFATLDKIYYLHVQSTAATTWNITHNLNRPVQVRCKNADDENIVGEPFDDSMIETSIIFTVAVEGTALCT